MRIRLSRSSLCLSLLAALWASAAAPANAQDGTATPTQEAGSVTAPLSLSRFSIDLRALSETGCGDPEGIPIDRPVSRCKGSAINLSAPDEPGQPQTSSGQVEASCGVLGYTQTIDSVTFRTGPQMAMREVPGDPGHGVFAGVVDLETTFRFTHRETGRTTTLPLHLSFTLAGPYILADPEGLPTGDNLILLADRVGDQLVGIEWCSVQYELEVVCMQACFRPHWKVPVDEILPTP